MAARVPVGIEYRARDINTKKTAQSIGKANQQMARDVAAGSNLSIKSFAKFGAAIASAGAAVFAFQKTISSAFDAAKLASQLQNARKAFNNIATEAGSNAQKIVNDIRTATRGTISEIDTLLAASRANLLGLPIDELGRLAEIARASALATGQSTSQLFDDIVVGIGRTSPLILDNLGITVKIGDATEAYAKALGRSAQSLTEAERKQAFFNAVLEAGEGIIQKVGDTVEGISPAEAFERATAAAADLRAEIGEFLLPLVTELLERSTSTLRGVFDFLESNREAIFNFFLNFGEVANAALAAIAEGFKGLFSAESILRIIGSGLKEFVNAWIRTAENSLIIMRTFGRTVLEILTALGASVAPKVTRTFVEFINTVIEFINGLLEPINDFINNQILGAINKVIEGVNKLRALIPSLFGEGEFGPVGFTAGAQIPTLDAEALLQPRSFEQVLENITGIWQEGFADLFENQRESALTGARQLAVVGQEFGQAFRDGFIPVLEEILGRELPEALRRPLQDLVQTAANAAAAAAGPPPELSEEDQALARFKAIDRRIDQPRFGIPPEVEEFDFAPLLSGFDAVAGVVGGLGESFLGLLTGTDAFQQAMGTFNDRLQAVVSQAVEPLLNAIAPLLDAFLNVAQIAVDQLAPIFVTLGQVLDGIAPIIQNVLGQLISQIIAPALQTLGQLLVDLQPLWDALGQVLIAVFKLFQPLIPILAAVANIIGQFLTPVLQVLAPILDGLADVLLFVTNVIIRPVFQVIGFAVGLVANVFIAVAKALAGLVWLITFGAVNIKTPNFIPLENFLAPEVVPPTPVPAAGDLATEFGDVGGPALFGGDTTVQRVPDIFVHLHFEAPVVGEGGPAEVGRFVAEALQEFVGIGGELTFIEAGSSSEVTQ